MTTGKGSQSPASVNFAFISSNFTWGGSEELWSETAAELARRGHRVTAYKNRLSLRDGNVAALKAAGCRLVELARFPFLPNQAYSLVAKFVYPLSIAYQAVRLHVCLRLRRRPDLVVVSQGGNHDGWLLTGVCRRLRLPYVLLSQKATDLYWPEDRWLGHVQAGYRQALHCFFVAEHNVRLTEEQIGARIANATVVRNPFKVPWDRPAPWPSEQAGFRFACVGRLYPKEKGQDLLLRVLSAEKWRRRPVSLAFFGTGEQQQGLRNMAEWLGLANVTFEGHVDDIAGLWAAHHALILPSRAEGLPLVVVEAMLAGRIPIVTDVAGNAEAVVDGETGFLAAAPTENALDAAMERAWQRRDEWPEIGRRAAATMRGLVPPDPPKVFAAQLLAIAAGRAQVETGARETAIADAAE